MKSFIKIGLFCLSFIYVPFSNASHHDSCVMSFYMLSPFNKFIYSEIVQLNDFHKGFSVKYKSGKEVNYLIGDESKIEYASKEFGEYIIINTGLNKKSVITCQSNH